MAPAPGRPWRLLVDSLLFRLSPLAPLSLALALSTPPLAGDDQANQPARPGPQAGASRCCPTAGASPRRVAISTPATCRWRWRCTPAAATSPSPTTAGRSRACASSTSSSSRPSARSSSSTPGWGSSGTPAATASSRRRRRQHHRGALLEGAQARRGADLRLEPPQKPRRGGEAHQPGLRRRPRALARRTDAYAAHVFGASVAAVDVLRSGAGPRRAPRRGLRYARLARRRDRLRLGVGRRARRHLRRPHARPRGEILVGEHPNAMALSPDGPRLFVACANTNAVWVLDVAARRRSSRCACRSPRRSPRQPPTLWRCRPTAARCWSPTPTTTPSPSSTCATRGRRASPASSQQAGTPPASPSAAATGRSSSSRARGWRRSPTRAARSRSRATDTQYIAGLLAGRSAAAASRRGGAAAMSERVFSLRPASAGGAARSDGPSPFPRRPGDPPIRYVFYVIRENRTYDQVLGDLPRGTATPTSRCSARRSPQRPRPRRRVRPARQLLRRRRGERRRSRVLHRRVRHRRGREAVADDYGGRGGLYLRGRARRPEPLRQPRGPRRGYLWDFAARAGVSCAATASSPTGTRRASR